MSYMAIKHLHLTAVALSVILFIVRFLWAQKDATVLAKKWSKILPHVVNTVLLVSAIWMLVVLEGTPFGHGWLAVKLLGLILYIVLGLMAMKWAKTNTMKWGAFFAALIVLGGTVKIALLKSVPFL